MIFKCSIYSGPLLQHPFIWSSLKCTGVGGRQRNWRSALVDHTKESLLISASAAESWWEYGHLVILYQQLETRSRRLFWLFQILNIELCSMQIRPLAPCERTAEMGDSIDVIYPALFIPIILFSFYVTLCVRFSPHYCRFSTMLIHTQRHPCIHEYNTSTYHIMCEDIASLF